LHKFIKHTLFKIILKKFLVYFCFLALSFSCKKDDVIPEDDNELITTVELTFTDVNKKSSTFSFQDKDGDAKTSPEKFDKITLDKNMEYSLNIQIYDETKNPRKDITEEIKVEGDVHLFIYKIDPVSLISFKIVDLDKNGLGIGLKSSVKSQNVPGIGKFNLILKHQPPVNGKVVKNGNEAGGSTDIDLVFDLIII
jgi:hypothetical protein